MAIKDGIKTKNHNGYIIIKIGELWQYEHRLIVEQHIKRFLKVGEAIHHLDGNRENNNIENLMLFPNQTEHKKFENDVRQFGLTNPIKRRIEERWNVV